MSCFLRALLKFAARRRICTPLCAQRKQAPADRDELPTGHVSAAAERAINGVHDWSARPRTAALRQVKLRQVKRWAKTPHSLLWWPHGRLIEQSGGADCQTGCRLQKSRE